MLYIVDLKTDEGDDLIVENGDFLIEDDGYASAIKTAERRACARYDDFPLDDIAAGIERLLYQNIDVSRHSIIFELSRAMKANGLLSSSEFDIIIPKTDQKTAQVFIKINSNLTNSNGFRVIVDQLNQNSYR